MSDTVGSYYRNLKGDFVGPFPTNAERNAHALANDGPFWPHAVGDTWVNPDPQRTLDICVLADGSLHFTANFREPGCFTGVLAPDGGVIAYVYPVDVIALTDETECVTCLDSYEALRLNDEARAAAGATPRAALDPEQQEVIGDLWEANTSREFDAILALSAAIGFDRAKTILQGFAS